MFAVGLRYILANRYHWASTKEFSKDLFEQWACDSTFLANNCAIDFRSFTDNGNTYFSISYVSGNDTSGRTVDSRLCFVFDNIHAKYYENIIATICRENIQPGEFKQKIGGILPSVGERKSMRSGLKKSLSIKNRVCTYLTVDEQVESSALLQKSNSYAIALDFIVDMLFDQSNGDWFVVILGSRQSNVDHSDSKLLEDRADMIMGGQIGRRFRENDGFSIVTMPLVGVSKMSPTGIKAKISARDLLGDCLKKKSLWSIYSRAFPSSPSSEEMTEKYDMLSMGLACEEVIRRVGDGCQGKIMVLYAIVVEFSQQDEQTIEVAEAIATKYMDILLGVMLTWIENIEECFIWILACLGDNERCYQMIRHLYLGLAAAVFAHRFDERCLEVGEDDIRGN